MILKIISNKLSKLRIINQYFFIPHNISHENSHITFLNPLIQIQYSLDYSKSL